MQHATAKSAAQTRPMPPPEPARGVLLPGFTAVNNSYYLEIQNRLTLAELRLLNVLIYFTNGYLRRWCIIGEEALCRRANIARSTLYETKKSLEAQGLIKIGRQGWACKYSLGDRLGVLADDTAPPPKLRQKFALVDPNPSGSVDTCRDTQDNYDQQQAPQAPESSDPIGDDESLEVVIQELEREWTEEDPAQATTLYAGERQATTLPQYPTAETGRLVAQLIEQGVHARVAARLATTQPPEVICAAIARLPKIATNNPAGYLVAEISRGGYTEPDRTKPIRVIHEEIHRLRQSERNQEVEAKNQASQATANALDRFRQLPPEQQAEIRRQVDDQAQAEHFTGIPGWGQNHPTYRGLLAEVVTNALG